MTGSLVRALLVVLLVSAGGLLLPHLGVPDPAPTSAPAPPAAPLPEPVDPDPIGPASPTPAASPSATPTATAPSAVPAAPAPTTPARPLAGVVVALDPGHQLGNARFPDEVNALVDAGGLRKPCNTTGTATDAGVPEATVTWQVAARVRSGLEALGASVRLTREANSAERWGPCVDERGRFAARVGADLLVSLHGDGSLAAGAEGFHVIAAPGSASSVALARSLRDALAGAGLTRAAYVGDGSGLDLRDDLGTLNLATVPAAMVEMGNLRDPGDARRLTSPAGQERYAAALVQGVRTGLGR